MRCLSVEKGRCANQRILTEERGMTRSKTSKTSFPTSPNEGDRAADPPRPPQVHVLPKGVFIKCFHTIHRATKGAHMKKKCAKAGLIIFSLLGIGCCILLGKDIIISSELSQIYELPKSQLEEVLPLHRYYCSSIDTLDDTGQIQASRQFGLSGAVPLGPLAPSTQTIYTIQFHQFIGKGKLAFHSLDGKLLLWAPENRNEHGILQLDAGSYTVYFIGAWFWGDMTISANS